ncbi:MAG: protoheme IX farnesyltransferase [Rhodobacteraceae bacterium]|nr:protoheme IX farnesyltransferase [Paracoccaceae bacterium]
MADVSHIDTQEYEAQFGDYVELLKPRVMRLVVFTALVGMLVAPVPVHPVIAIASILCIAIGAGASGALNMWWDRDIDAIMKRTQGRPIPSGRVQPGEALAIGLALSGLSVMMLAVFANIAAAGWLAFTIFFYVVVYSIGLKRLTPQNIVIGGAAGAFPPLLGWVVATGSISVEPILLVALILIWTPPHFWALALWRNEDYKAAGIPMLPVMRGERVTRRYIFGYTLLLIPVALAPSFTQIGGLAYLAVSLVLNAVLLAGAWRLLKRQESDRDADNFRAEKQFFGFTIVYLFVHFLMLLVEATLRALDLSITALPIWF